MAEVDIHLLSSPGRGVWRDQALESLSGQPCNVHVVEAIPGHTIGQMRQIGFMRGREEFVGYADDDDLVCSGAVDALVSALGENPAAVGAYTDEVLVNEAGAYLGPGASTGRDYSLRRHLGSLQFVHHLWIARRSAIEPYLGVVAEMPVGAHWALTCLASIQGAWVHVPVVGYHWRQHRGSSRKSINHGQIKQMARRIVTEWIDAQITTVDEMPAQLL